MMRALPQHYNRALTSGSTSSSRKLDAGYSQVEFGPTLRILIGCPETTAQQLSCRQELIGRANDDPCVLLACSGLI